MEPRRTIFSLTFWGTFSFAVFKFFIALYLVYLARASISLTFLLRSGSEEEIALISRVF